MDGISPQIFTRDFRPAYKVSLLVNHSAEILLEIVDECIERFGEPSVLYV